ncbi:putative tricarboxylic transport membrane protein [Nitrobacteraceae bacterium AZCC 1564]
MERQPLIAKSHVRIASAILTGAGLIYFYNALQLPLGDPLGTGVGAVPTFVGILWIIFGLYVTCRDADIQIRDSEVGTWPDRQMAIRLGLALVLCFGFIIVMPLLGTVATSGLFLLLMGRLAGAPWGKSLVASVALPVFFWLVFVKLLKVSLPVGSLFAFATGG